MRGETAIGGPARGFPSTRWTLFLSAAADPAARQRALEELATEYWKPLYCFARCRGLGVEESKDAVQGFLAQLVERDFPALDPARGRLRSYLRTGLANYLANLHERDAARKRGGGARPARLDFDLAERHLDGAARGPEAAFEREWALGVMERALGALERELERRAGRGRFTVLRRFFQAGEAPDYASAARECGLSLTAFKVFLHRARARFRELVREQVRETVAGPGDEEQELGDLFRALRGP